MAICELYTDRKTINCPSLCVCLHVKPLYSCVCVLSQDSTRSTCREKCPSSLGLENARFHVETAPIQQTDVDIRVQHEDMKYSFPSPVSVLCNSMCTTDKLCLFCLFSVCVLWRECICGDKNMVVLPVSVYLFMRRSCVF